VPAGLEIQDTLSRRLVQPPFTYQAKLIAAFIEAIFAV
jgi:hypothetical protein